MFIEQVYKAHHEWWRYILGILIVGAGVVIGQIPLTIAILWETGFEFIEMTEGEMMKVLESNLFFFLLLLSFAAGLGALLLAIRYLHNQPILEATTSRRKMDWGRFFFGFGLIGLFTVITVAVDYASNPQDFLWNFDFVPFAILLLIALVMVPLQTSFEEYLFRGYLMQGLGVMAGNRWVPLVVTSVIFGGLHFFNPEVTKMGNIIMVYYIGTGFLFGIMTLMDEGMELALGFHAGNNLIGALLVTADWTAFQTNSLLKDISDPTAGLDVLFPIFVIYPLFLFIMAKMYNWTDWKGKLFGKVHKPEIIKTAEEI